MQLLFWRHAEAEDGVPDLERKLTTRGHKQAEAVATWLRPRLPKGCLILVSPAQRARQTVAALKTLDFEIDPRIAPGAAVDAVLGAIGFTGERRQARAVMLVGHQPWIGQTIAHLMTGHAEYWGVRKAGLWWLDDDDSGRWTLRTVVDRDLL